MYIADTYNNRIRKVSNGIITTVAGTGQLGSTGDGGSALAAQLYLPTRLAVDANENIYFTETINPAITPEVRKVDSHGIISKVAGGGLDLSDGIPATQAGMLPLAVAVDGNGNLYIVDSFGMGIRKVDSKGIITTVAGGKQIFGFAGDGGPALNAQFAFEAFPSIAVDSGGNIYVDDEANERVRKITPSGIINTVAGNGRFRLSGNGGPAASATLDYPLSVTGDPSGNLFITEQLQNRIRRIAPDGTISIYAGNGQQGFTGDGGPAGSASIAFPAYLTIAPSGALFFSDTVNCRVRYIDHNGIINTYAGGGGCSDSGDGGPANQAGMRAPMGIDIDPAGDLVIAEPQSNRIRVVLAPPDYRIATLAGNGNPGYSGDRGSAPQALVNGPIGVRYHGGFFYFCDTGNHVVRKIDTNSLTITTVAGNGKSGFSGDGGPAISASLSNPQSINFDAAGNMYIADQLNRLIRMVTPGGTISTFAGSMAAKTENDGDLATNAGLGAPSDVFIDQGGTVFFTDVFYNRVRAVLVNPPTFQATPSSLAFTGPAGSDPVTLAIDLVGSIPGIPYTLTASSSGWLQATPTSGFMPASLVITADPSKLSAGPHTGTITITAPDTRPATQSIGVTLTTTAPGAPSLSVKPSSLSFSFVQKSPGRSRALTVANAGGGSLHFTAATSTVSGGSWLSATPGSGTLNAFASQSVNIAVDPSKLIPGTYSGTVTLASADPVESVIVPVTVTVSAVQQTILIPQTGLTFFAVKGGGSPPPQDFNILNSGSGLMPFTISSSTLSGGPWLSVFPNSGSSDASSNIVPQIRVQADPKGLASGVYYGTIKVTSQSADNNPQFVTVVLNVLAAGSKIGPIVQPTGLIFSAIAGGESPGSQTVTVENTDSAPVTYQSGRATTDGGAWFTWLPKDATISPNQPVRIIIQPQIAGLAAGVHPGSLTLSFSDGSTRTITILLVLVPPGTVLSRTETQATASAACVPKKLYPVFTELSPGFSTPAGLPGQVAVKVVDNCATPMAKGDVTASFSNGDASLQLISLKDGTWARTWIPQFPAAQVTVTVDVQNTDGLTGSAKVTGSLLANSQPPVVGPGAIVNGASYASGTPVAPGSLIAVFGSKLAQGNTSASNLPLPTDLGGSSIVLAGRAAPLLFASDGQVNAMIPFGTAVNTGQQLFVTHGTATSVPQTVTLSAVAPGVFTKDGSGKGQGTIFLGNSRNLADAAHPAHSGDVVVIYCTGLGEVNPPVVTGTPAPAAPPAQTVNQVKVTIGGLPATVQFSGLTPGLVGVYQVNAVVPAIKAGDQVPVVLTSAGQQSPPVTIVAR